MKVIILAAGIGSRLRPLTHSKPKGMVKVNGMPIIEHQIKAYLQAGVRLEDINIVVGYKANFIDDFLNSEYPEINIITNELYDTTNNMFSLDLCLNAIDADDTFISNGDCVYDPAIMESFISNGPENSVASDKDSYTDENMKIIVQDNKIKHISKQIKQPEAYGNSIDLYRVSRDSIPRLKELIKQMIEEDPNLWSELALDKLFAFVDFEPFDILGRHWMEIDNYDDLYEAERKFSAFSLDTKKSLVFDLDGTVYLGSRPIQNTIDFIKENDNRFDFYYMTNNTSKSLSDYVKKLSDFGISTSLDKIISPLIPLIEYLEKHNLKNIYIVGNSTFKEYLQSNLKNVDFTNDRDKCQAVLVAYDTELDYEKLKDASILLHDEKIKFLATHQDVVCPTEYGDIPDIGAILKLLELTTHRTPTTFFGKPNAVLLDPITRKYKTEEIAIIGDRLYTDKVLANNAMIDFIMVLSGETKREDIEDVTVFPELIVKDMGDMS